MRVHDLVRRLSPPLLVDLMLRHVSLRPKVIWEGIYRDFQCMPVHNGSYDHEERVAEFVERVSGAISSGGEAISWHSALGLLGAAISGARERLCVLDFGGGVGLAFVQLQAAIRGNPDLRYHVVDLERMCVAGSQLFVYDQRIQFHTSLPQLEEEIDVVYASSVLPYIDDYAGLLRQLAALNGRFILLTQLATGSFPTYAARQLNLPGQVLPYWFLNLDEVIAVVSAEGYSLAYQESAGPEYDQSNYPEAYRLGRMRNLLFVRRD